MYRTQRILLATLFFIVTFCCDFVAFDLVSLPQIFAIENEETKTSATQLSDKIRQAWDVSWKRFYRDDTHLFYDFLSSYEPGQELAHLPTPEEAQQQFPNECGYDTGMEDCMISAGVMMSLVLDKYAVTRDESLRERAFEIYQGIRLCATANGDGFLARAVCHQDLKSFYPNSSRDQYTHAVYGLWLYSRSPLCSEETRRELGGVLAAIADRMVRNVIPENDYDSLRADGSRDTRGISRMWNVQPHEAARLPMIYAATWDVTGDQKYRELWRKYVSDAVQQSFEVDHPTTYSYLQMQESLQLLLTLEMNPKLQKQMRDVMHLVSERCRKRALSADRQSHSLDLTEHARDWRLENGGISSKGTYRKSWYCIRESGEAALAQLTDSCTPFPEQQKSLLFAAINRLNFDRVSSNGIFYLQAAYWKLLREVK